MSSVHSIPTPHCTAFLSISKGPKSLGLVIQFFSRQRSGQHPKKVYFSDLCEHKERMYEFVFRVRIVFLHFWLHFLYNCKIIDFHRGAFNSVGRTTRGFSPAEYPHRGCLMDVLSQIKSPVGSPTSQLRVWFLYNSPIFFSS